MAKFNIKKIIDGNTKDDVVDYDAINIELETQNKNVVAKEIEKELAKVDKGSIIKTFLNDNEFKSLDDFNAFKKNGATVDTEAVKRLEGELKIVNDALKLKTDVELALTKELSPYKNQALLRKAELNSESDIEYIEYQINKLEGETFEDKLTAYKETNPDVFTQTAPKSNVVTTGVKLGNKPPVGQKLAWETIVDNRYGEEDK